MVQALGAAPRRPFASPGHRVDASRQVEAAGGMPAGHCNSSLEGRRLRVPPAARFLTSPSANATIPRQGDPVRLRKGPRPVVCQDRE